MYTHLRLDEVDSTNTYAKQHFFELPDGSVISARRQTAGKGRVGRKWLSGDGLDITASFLFKNLHFYDIILLDFLIKRSLERRHLCY